MKLKPCPFCGSEARLVGPRMYEGFDLMMTVECLECLATIYCNDKKEAIKAWNKRC